MRKVLAIVLAIVLIPAIAYCLPERLSASVDLTPSGTYVDVGDEIVSKGADNIGIFITTEGKAASAIDLKILAKHTSGGTDEYLFPDMGLNTNLTITEDFYTIGISASLTNSYCINVKTDGVIPYLQVQGKSRHANLIIGNNAVVTSLKVVRD